jgi:hypothetical protein
MSSMGVQRKTRTCKGHKTCLLSNLLALLSSLTALHSQSVYLPAYIRKADGSYQDIGKSKSIPVTGPPLWSSGRSSWLQIQKSGFDSQRYQTFWEVVGLERDPLSLVSTIEELLERKSRDSGLEIREYGRRVPLWWPCDTIYSQKSALTSPTSGDRSVGIVRLWTKATEISL